MSNGNESVPQPTWSWWGEPAIAIFLFILLGSNYLCFQVTDNPLLWAAWMSTTTLAYLIYFGFALKLGSSPPAEE